MEGVDWVATLIGLTVMIALVIVAWSAQLLIDAVKRWEVDEGQGPGAPGS